MHKENCGNCQTKLRCQLQVFLRAKTTSPSYLEINVGLSHRSFKILLCDQKLTNHIFRLPVFAIDGIVELTHLLDV